MLLLAKRKNCFVTSIQSTFVAVEKSLISKWVLIWLLSCIAFHVPWIFFTRQQIKASVEATEWYYTQRTGPKKKHGVVRGGKQVVGGVVSG